MDDFSIPTPIIKEAKELVEIYGDNFGYLGKYQGKDAYLYIFPEDVEIGFPFIYLYNTDNQMAYQINGQEALDLLDKIR